MGMTIPVISVAALVGGANPAGVAAEIRAACREHGFFYISDHGVDPGLQHRLETLSQQFFALPQAQKMKIRMELGGVAWRGYFPVGDELTSGRPDIKEGIYFGAELPATDPRVRAGLPLHGPNLMPTEPAGLGPAVLEYMDALTHLGHALMRGVALSLDLQPDWFAARYTADPTVLFRIFNYPPAAPATPGDPSWGVGEHTDYGLLTILRQDHNGGLEVRGTDGEWLTAPPIPGTFVCNIGDMLDRLTGGHFRSTPHRVVSSTAAHRLSWPFFFDPAWQADVRAVGEGALANTAVRDDRARRWDGASVHEFAGTYGDYLVGKVSKVFPALRNAVL